MSSSKQGATPLTVVFFGSPEFSIPSLEAAHRIARIPAVVTQPARPSGRGHLTSPCPVACWAEGRIPTTYCPASRAELLALVPDLAAIEPDLFLVVAYGALLPRELLAIPRLGSVNLHASLLPRWRGAAPIEWAILAGDQETGISIMRLDPNLDQGPVLAQHALPIDPRETGPGLSTRMAQLGGKITVDAIRHLTAGESGTLQTALTCRPCYARKLKKADTQLDWNLPAVDLDRRIRAHYPCAWFEDSGVRYRIVEAQPAVLPEPLPDSSSNPSDRKAFDPPTLRAGEVRIQDGELWIGCGDGSLKATSLQREGRKILSAPDFLRGIAWRNGHILTTQEPI